MGKLILFIGGARSGKSTFAEALAAKLSRDVTYIATAQALDDEMADRIRVHRSARPAAWPTLEIPLNLGPTLLNQPPASPVVLLDCITLLVSNTLLATACSSENPPQEPILTAVQSEIRSLLEAISASAATWLLVTNEVGSGVVPAYPLGRAYRDGLGWANQRIASVADEIYYLVAGRALPLHKLGKDLEEFLSNTGS
ncbi:MAG: bifunctional adenosylcobinamide kinase/adenosylcobinamide-phosphate guanylyltransferase [Anaerolineae bacterium]|nr:MAG: bifunctional adenosylcobinamide kinase/adenosylcobinamide-phosphate guanylyltransferase [Anaerolineae bacterium]